MSAAYPDRRQGATGETGPPSFSIVVPTFNRRETVSDSLRAIGSIDYPGAVEVIVVVDGATDGTAEALAAIECPFPLTIVEQPNQGPGSARNRGAAVATGDILLFLDDDMMCDPDILRHRSKVKMIVHDEWGYDQLGAQERRHARPVRQVWCRAWP